MVPARDSILPAGPNGNLALQSSAGPIVSEKGHFWTHALQRINYSPCPYALGPSILQGFQEGRPTEAEKYDMGLISVLIGVLVIVVVGAICFWAIDKFAADRRLSQLLKLLVVLICLGAILQRVLPLI
jgi:hypothetical protein